MLSTIAPQPSKLPSARSAPPISSFRKRGAQPHNGNAFKHGLYSPYRPTRLTIISNSISGINLRLRSSLSSLGELLLETQTTIEKIMNNSKKGASFPQFTAETRLLIRATKTSALIKVLIWVAGEESRYLRLVARFSLELGCYEFYEYGITRDADSFRVELKKSDLNSIPLWKPLLSLITEPFLPFMPDRQWSVIASLIPPPENAGKRGRPPSDPRELLGAIFWKFAHNARWQDLPAGSPPMLTCRRYYRRLFLSGRLATIYKVLHKDLVDRGQVNLVDLVERGCFSIGAKNIILLNPDLAETWQLRTALLFMQQGYRMFRHMVREKALARRRGY